MIKRLQTFVVYLTAQVRYPSISKDRITNNQRPVVIIIFKILITFFLSREHDTPWIFSLSRINS